MLEMPIVPEEREERNFREGDFAIEVTKRIIRLRRALRYDVMKIYNNLHYYDNGTWIWQPLAADNYAAIAPFLSVDFIIYILNIIEVNSVSVQNVEAVPGEV